METEVKDVKHSLTVLWRIDNISLWKSGSDGEEITSPDFTPLVLEGKSFRLVLFRKLPECPSKYLSLSPMCDGDAFDFPIDCEVSLFGRDRLPLVIGTARNHVIGKDGFHIVFCFLTEEEVFVTKKSTFLPQDVLTLKCRFWKSDGNFSETETISTRSRMERLENFFLWPISKFSSLELNQELTRSVRFYFPEGSDDFLLKFSLKGESLESASAFVELGTVSLPFSKTVSLKVSVLTNEEAVLKRVEMKSRVGSKPLEIPISVAILTKEELQWQKSGFKNYTLRLLCDISCVQCTSIVEKNCYVYSKVDDSEGFTRLDAISTPPCGDPSDVSSLQSDSLGKDLLILYKDKIQTDFKLRLGEVFYPVHKLILSARSNFFRAKFCKGVNESDSNCMDIQDLDADTLNWMLIFVYSGAVNGLVWQNALKLYYAAHQYQIQSLKEECCFFLRSNTNVSNVSDIFLLADKHKDDELKSFVHEFISRNYNHIVNSAEWHKYEGLVGKSMRQIYLKNIETKSEIRN